MKGFIGRLEKKFDARLRLDEQWKVVFECSQQQTEPDMSGEKFNQP